MAGQITKQQAEAIIRQTAAEAGASDLADVLVATAIQETGLDIYIPGDNNRSWGPFHEYDEGRGAGLTVEQRQDVPGATRRAIAEFRQQQKAHPNASPGELAVFAQRPAEKYRPGYIAAVNRSVQQMASGQGNQVNGKSAAGNGLPTAVLANSVGGGRAERNGLPTAVLLSNTSASGVVPKTGATGTAGGSAWPLPGGKVSNIFGGPQGRSSGMKGSLPSTNVGVDISGAKEGSPVVAPVSGEVVRVYQSQGVGNADENGGWGGMVLVKGNDGYFHRLSHLQQGSVAVKPGDQVRAGQPVAKVGATGNTMAGGKGPFVHVDWEKFQTGTGNPDDRKTMTFTDPTLAGAAGGNGVAEPVKVDTSSPDYQARRTAYINQQIAANEQAKATLAAKEALEQDPQYVEDSTKLKAAEDFLKANPTRPPAKVLREGATVLPGNNPLPWDWIDNTDAIKKWDEQQKIKADYTQAAGNVERPEKTRLDEAVKAIKAKQTEYDNYAKQINKDAGDEFDRDENAKATEAAKTQSKTYQIDSESGTVLENGKPVFNLPREAKPGQTFSVPGRGTWIVNEDGKSATQLVAPSNSELYKWEDAGDRLVEIGPNGPTGKSIGKGELGARPTVLGGTDGPKLTIWDPFDKSIKTIDNEGYKPPKPDVISAPKDVRYIVQADKDGKITSTDNPNYDPNTGGTNQVTGSGRVAHIDASGKVTSITDTLTPDERALYDRGKRADVGKSEADSVKTLIDAAKSLHDQEMERRTQELWETAQKVAANPNATRDDVIAAIQAGAKNATEWSTVFQTHINQKTQEEVARKNRVDESIKIQDSDRQLREGLYKDINETRNQRQLAQGRSNEAIKGSGIIGEANSMNALAAMAPVVGQDGITRAGTIGLGVGAGAIEPVQKTYQEHLDEIENLRKQMPSVRLANPDAGGKPDFSIPRPSGTNPVTAVANKPNQSSQLGTALLDKAKGIMENNPIITGMSGTPDVASGQKPNSGVPMGGSGISVATGQSVDEMAEEERKKQQGGGGYRGPRFRVPKPKARRAA